MEIVVSVLFRPVLLYFWEVYVLLLVSGRVEFGVSARPSTGPAGGLFLSEGGVVQVETGPRLDGTPVSRGVGYQILKYR